MQATSSLFPSAFYTDDLHFDQGKTGCQIGENGQIEITSSMKREKMVEVASKIGQVPLLIENTTVAQRERFLNNLLAFRRNIPFEKSLISIFKHKTSQLPFTLQYTTCHKLDNFSDPVQCSLFHMFHYTTYPQPKDTYPTDHAGMKELPEGGFHMVVCDGLGHGDKGIGKIAQSITQKVLEISLLDKIHPDKGEENKEREAYQGYLKTLMTERQCGFETTLLEAEISLDSAEAATVRFANFGDCALIVLNPQGQVTYASRDRTKEKIEVQRTVTQMTQDPAKAKTEVSKAVETIVQQIGMLAIGQPVTQAQYLDYHKLSVVRGSIVIACSDGLTEPFVSKETGFLDLPRFESACRTGIYYLSDSPLPKLSPKLLEIKNVSDNLNKAAWDSAQQRKNGDDTTILLVKV